jgi:transposase-like protein
MAKVKRKKRQRYTEAKRASILAAANKDNLTATQVHEKFGVTPVTYYSWRKKVGAGVRRGRPSRAGDLNQELRLAARKRIQELMPTILRSEIDAYIKSNLGGKRRGRPRG